MFQGIPFLLSQYSLQELSKAVNGDGKAAPNPLFKVKVVLKNNKVFQVLVHLVPQILCIQPKNI
jgi:hypothetical protein